MSTEPGRQGPEASVIIACYNATDTLPKQLEALSRQENAPSFEVILSDNGSDDGLLALADEWAHRLDVQYVWSGQMPGAAYARNVGMSIARADKWLFCDADDVVAADWVACGARTLERAQVFSGGAVHANDQELEAALERLWARFAHESGPIEVAEEPAEWPIIMGGNFGILRSAALAVGGFDASMVFGVEDNDLAVRLEESGFFISAGNTSRIIYRKRNDLASVLRRSLSAGRGQIALVKRHGLASRSPSLRGHQWMLDPLRVAGAVAKSAARGRQGDWLSVASRAALAVGMWQGWLQYHIGRDLPAPRVGAGLADDELGLAAGAAVLVLSPHLDDAMFSCAELIRRTRPDVWTVFAGDPEPPVTTSWDRSCGFPDSHSLVTQRRREDFDTFEGTGAQVRHLDMLDGAYTTPERRSVDMADLAQEVRRWLADHIDQDPVVVLPGCAGVAVSPGVLDRLAPVVQTLRRKKLLHRDDDSGAFAGSEDQGSAESSCIRGASDETTRRSDARDSASERLVADLKQFKHRLYQRRRAHAQQSGLAVNGDHLAVRDAVLDVVLQAGSPIRVLLAEDLPYLWSQTGDDEVVRLADRLGKRAIPHEFHVDRSWKCDRLTHYVSQLEVMDSVHHRFNRAETIPLVERCWELLDR
ncbi:MAG: glycosyltransferase [Acidipropionibacterium sp.]|jgi:GT2 family glycosyltransferase|nr:glycosyltransferase [Acidipropionibacterium sp.]